jgi:hypothetical protein
MTTAYLNADEMLPECWKRRRNLEPSVIGYIHQHLESQRDGLGTHAYGAIASRLGPDEQAAIQRA